MNPLLLFPAIDLIHGKCVRLTQGRFDDAMTYGDDPVAMARHWVDQGATWLHVVDLDGARAGSPKQLDVARAIAREAPVPVQLGGGFRQLDQIESALEAGIRRIILGSVAVKDPDLARQAFQRYGEQVVLGLDAMDGKIAVHGWQEVGSDDAMTLAKAMEAAGARRIIFTDIGRDGMLTGVNVEATRKLSDAVNCPVIASGGVAHLDDLKALARIGGRGVEGVIIGKALYTEAFTLPQAHAVVEAAALS